MGRVARISGLIAKGQASATDPTTRPAYSVAYLDYWDWYTKLTSKGVKSTKSQAISDGLDSGGSWGAAVEIIKSYGVMRSGDFVGTGKDRDIQSPPTRSQR